MQYTLGDLKPHLAPFADGGLCADDTGGPGGTNRVVLRINEAVERLANKSGWPGLIRCVRMCVYNGCVTVGRDIKKILKARVDGCFTNVFDKWYEFLEAGPGMLEDDSSQYVDLVDRDMVPTQYDIPEPMRIMVFSDEAEVVDAQILIRGHDETNREVRTLTDDGWIFGEYVPITRDVGYYSRNKFSHISSIIKPVTNGYVYLSAVAFDTESDPNTMTREHLAIYHPDETRPSYRRYGFKTSAYSEVCDRSYRLNALVKMNVIPMSRDSDVCLISNLPALKTMLQAMRYFDSGDLNKGQAFEKQAEAILLEDADNYETVRAIQDVQVHGYGNGDIEPV
jgi:hypothetical protein